MTKKYWIKRGDFANVYSLAYTTSAAEDAQALNLGFERITRAEAFRLCARENDRRRYDSAFSGYADSHIFPIGWTGDNYPQQFDGYLVIR